MYDNIIAVFKQEEPAPKMNLFQADPSLAEIPISVHPPQLLKGNGSYSNTYCRDALRHPLLYKKWGVSQLTSHQKKSIVSYGKADPDWRAIIEH